MFSCTSCGRTSPAAPSGLLVVCLCGARLQEAFVPVGYRDASVVEAPLAPICPACHSFLRAGAITGGDRANESLECLQCYGLFASENALFGLFAAHAISDGRTLLDALEPVVREMPDPAKLCPFDRAPLLPVRLVRNGRTVHLDRCAVHGIWFDAHELGSVLNAGKGAEVRAREVAATRAAYERNGALHAQSAVDRTAARNPIVLPNASSIVDLFLAFFR